MPVVFGLRLILYADLHGDVVDLRSDILGQVIQGDAVDVWSCGSRVQHGFPLGVTSRGNSGFIVFAEVDLLPRAPVAVGIIDVAAAGVKIHIANAAKFDASPARENLGVEDIALVGALGLRPGTEHKDLSQIAGGGVYTTAGRFGEGSHLRSRRFQQIGKIIQAGDSKNVAAISRAGQQASLRIEGEGVDDIFVRCPQPGGRTVGGYAINIRTAAGPAARKWETTLLSQGRWAR